MINIYNDFINSIVGSIEDYEQNVPLNVIINKDNRMFYFGIILVLLSIFLIPIID